jgi:hypothetical protein
MSRVLAASAFIAKMCRGEANSSRELSLLSSPASPRPCSFKPCNTSAFSNPVAPTEYREVCDPAYPSIQSLLPLVAP